VLEDDKGRSEMKANTPELMKFKRLQRRLGESRRGTIGLLESLWIEVSRNCPEGNVGRFSDEEIAIMVDWDGEPSVLVEALVECGWLDECATNRLVVHDWSDHCPTYVRGGLAKKGKVIAKAVQVQAEASQLQAIATSSEVQAECVELVPIACTSEVLSTKPSLSKPIQANSFLFGKSQNNTAYSPYLDDADFAKAFEAFKDSSRQNHNWTIAESTAEAWLMDLANLSLDEATRALWFSTAAGSKKPITNGDHNRKPTNDGSGKRRGPRVSFEDGLLT